MSRRELVNFVDHGLYIDNLEGLHSGLNPVSGDFSSAQALKLSMGK